MSSSKSNRTKWSRSLFYSLSIVAITWCIYWGWRGEQKTQKIDSQYTSLFGEIFHTYFSIKYSNTTDYSKEIDSVFAAFSHSLNPFDSNSLVSYINNNEAGPADSMLLYVWRASRDISEASGGSYDVTCSPLINAWGFGFSKLDSITPTTLDSLRGLVGYKRIHATADSLIKEDIRMKLDFSSISKGYCSDLVGRYLQAQGVDNYMVELGGEVAFKGYNPEGKPWQIGVNKPVDDLSGLAQDLQLIIALDIPQGGLATSGNYRNYKVIDGKKYAHTINPHTGYPIQTDVLSATIIAPSCMLADGLATACMTMHSDDIPEFISKFEGVEYMLILGGATEGFTTKMSPGFSRLVVSQN